MTEGTTEMGSVASGLRREIRREIEEEAEARGVIIGEARGEARGVKKGVKRATLETRTEIALNLMKSLKMSAEDVLSVMGVPARSRATVLKSINARLAAE